MIVDTMTYADIVRLYSKDVCGIIQKKKDAVMKSLFHVVNKAANVKPIFYKPVLFSSQSGIDYIMIVVNLGKQVPKDERVGVLLYGFYLQRRGRFAFTETYTPGGNEFKFFTPHFFERYRERFIRDLTMSISETMLTFINRNFTLMQTDIPHPKHPDGHYSVCDDGLCLSTFLGDGIVEMNTFVTFEMLYENQSQIVGEAQAAIEEFRRHNHMAAPPQAYFVDVRTHEVFKEV